MFNKQSSYRYQRSKGFKVKHAFQIALLVAVSIWLLYQVKHSHDRRQAYDEKKNEGKVEGTEDGGSTLGRKGKLEVFERSYNSVNGEKNEGNIEEEGESRDVHDNVHSGESENGDHGGGDDEIDRHEEERGEEEARQEEKDKETEGEIENVVNAEEGKRGDVEEEEQNGDIGSKFIQMRGENEEGTEATHELQDNGNEIPEFKDENHVEEEKNVENQSEIEENKNAENQGESEENKKAENQSESDENKHAEGQNDAGEDNNAETRREAEENKNSETQRESEEDKNPETQTEGEDTKSTETQNDVKEDMNTEKQGEGQEEKNSETESEDQENKNVEKETEGQERKTAEKHSSGEEDKTIEKQGETEADRNGDKHSGGEDDKNAEKQTGSEEGKNVEHKSDNEESKDVEKHSNESLGEQQMAPPLVLDGENKEKNSTEPGEVPNIVLKQIETVEASPDPKGDHSEEKTLDSGKIENIGSVKNEADALGGSNDIPAVDPNAKEGGEKLEEHNQDSNAKTSADSSPNPNVERENAKLEEISKEVNKSPAEDHEAAGLEQNSTVILESQAETLKEPHELATPETKKESEVTGQAEAENIKVDSSIYQGAVKNEEGQSHDTKSDNVEGNASTDQNSESFDQNQAANKETSSKTNETSEGLVNSTTSEENSTTETDHHDGGDVTTQDIPGENEAHDRTDLGTLPDTETGGQNSEGLSAQ